MTLWQRWLGAAALGLTALSALAAPAAEFPTRPITLIVPNAPGGAVDILARLLSDKLQARLGQNIIVLYKPGAGTVLGTDVVARAEPDGHTLGMVVTSHVINPSLRTNMPFDTQKDLAGVSLLASSQIVITASPELGARTLPDILALAKADPQRISYASPGSGSSMHMAGELLKGMAGVEMMHVPFKGAGPAYPEVISGRVSLLIDPLFSSLPHIQSGRLVPVAVTGPKRDPALPDVPTVAEVLPGFDVQSVFGVVAPAGTPPATLDTLSQAFGAVLAMPDIQARLAQIGMTPIGTTPKAFDAYIREEIAKWAPVVKQSGAQVDG
ncbi:tripartite tricarboxylate transporter substrate binding protein [Achromobacter sp. GG226]|uniref:tripartite tricarboxylate transporter substrate binding protein n=1 Tax=Verticiella alkaliphila TaxID=2779529 RepID=UPI001C0BA61F|nr:tripartite tricarboxylate transporter substrate binding protein [Verticiella sp. GG226]MBU4611836.1 tripartite tricarboxylate transporter substrate binding protein [Verticiella sp. GG226]